MSKKYIFITGGVCSSLGKGLTSASLGMLLERSGLKIAMLKMDPYLNVDPGTMNPYQHGEVYVTDDGAETDLDLGHYYRFSNSPLTKASNVTSGQIYNTVIQRERKGDYLGNTVQVIPHITDEIKQSILKCAKQVPDLDVILVEIGGTVGDIESLPFMEAIRQFENEQEGDCLTIHLTYIPFLKAAGEFKSKPTQHSVQQLRSIGIFPDIILCRCEQSLPEDVKEKVSLFCNVKPENVFEEVDVAHSIYEVPVMLHEQGIVKLITEALKLPLNPIDISDWANIVETIKKPRGCVTIGIVGKYIQHQDAYKSVFEALEHGAIAAGYSLTLKKIDADKLVHNGHFDEMMVGCDGYLVPGGFGERGWYGKILAARHCREKHIPFFGICLGMQVMAVEFARNVLGLSDANSTEINPDTSEPVISLLSEQKTVINFGGTMRLGSYPCRLDESSKAFKAYRSATISERHRHRYEFNNAYMEKMENAGFHFSGKLEGDHLCEIAEIHDHPWMVGVQFHPEFKSKPNAPHPLFKAFIEKAIAYKEGK